MSFDITLLRLAGALSSHSAARQALLAENIANADTPEYRAKDLEDFSTLYGQTSVGPTQMRAAREGHIGFQSGQASFEPIERTAFGAETTNGNNVALEDQIIRSAEVQQSHELAMGVYATAMDILRLGLGRRQ